jgi:hypothetical protein
MTKAPRELGDVVWGREHDTALDRARETGKPVFALFQEIPGCQTCVSFGEQVLSHPLLVEAIESEFVPLAVYNNRPGEDARILERYGEPSWNNPVVRLLDGQGRDLLPRAGGIYAPEVVGARMLAALEKAGRERPRYLLDAVEELRPHAGQRAIFEMYCYWSGEACLGAISGLLSSRAPQLRWRQPSRDSREAIEIVDQSFRYHPEPGDLLLRAPASTLAGQPAAALDTLSVFAQRIGPRNPERQRLAAAGLELAESVAAAQSHEALRSHVLSELVARRASR